MNMVSVIHAKCVLVGADGNKATGAVWLPSLAALALVVFLFV